MLVDDVFLLEDFSVIQPFFGVLGWVEVCFNDATFLLFFLWGVIKCVD